MYLSKRSKVEKCTLRGDATRPNLAHPFLDLSEAEKPKLVATDGHVLVALEVEVEDGDAQGLVPCEALAAARKLAVQGVASVHANGDAKLSNGASYPRPEGEFPNWRQVRPSRPATLRVGLNAALLRNIADAFDSNPLVLEIIDERSPIRVSPVKDDVKGEALIMPVALGGAPRLSERHELLVKDVWNAVFQTFDAEVETDAELCGRIAQAAANAVEHVLRTA